MGKLRLILLLCLFVSPLQAQRKRDDKSFSAPPPVVPQQIDIKAGDSVNIPLEIHGGRAERLEFLIRTRPKIGRLGAVKNSDVNSASVVYTVPKGTPGGVDTFTYAVSGSEGVSAPGLVTITIREVAVMPAKLIMQSDVDFPGTMLGRTSMATLEVRNGGGMPAAGEMTVKPPWKIDGESAYRLEAGEKMFVRLVFTPNEAGEQTGELFFGPEPRRKVVLRAAAEHSLSVAPALVTLKPKPGSQTRVGSFRIENHIDEAQTVSVEVGTKLIADGKVTVPARDGVEVPVFADAVDVNAFDEKITLTSGKWTAVVPVKAGPVGAMLRFVAGEPFGKIVKGRIAEGRVSVENTGGVDAVAKVSVGIPFRVAAPTVSVPAGSKSEIILVLPANAAGKLSAELVAEVGGRAEKIKISAEIEDAPASTPAKKETPDATAPAGEKPEAAPSPGGLPAPLPRIEFPNGMGNFAREVKETTAVLEWPVGLGPSSNLRVLEQQITAADGAPVIHWQPWAGVAFREAGTSRRAELSGLDPGRVYTMRVASGAEAVFTARFMTQREKPLVSWEWNHVAIVVLLAVFAGFLLWRWKNRERSGW